MWLITVLIAYMLTMLTTAHTDCGRPTPKDDEQFRNGLVRDLNEFTMNAKLTKLNMNINPEYNVI